MNSQELPTEVSQGRMVYGRYLILRTLGNGGMGRVYKAEDMQEGKTCALKQTFFSEGGKLQWFKNEAELLRRLNHPNLPKVYDHFDDLGSYFLVMDFIDGPNLGDELSKQGRFPVSAVMDWAEQLLQVLEYLHGAEPTPVTHRDIKPANIKIRGGDKIILLDFGLAKEGTTKSVPAHTRHYAPIEQEMGLGTDARSDIYSLGATLYHLLTGKMPEDAFSDRQPAVTAGKPDPLRPAHEVNPSIPQGVSAIISRAMEFARERRFASATEMREALGRCIALASTMHNSEPAQPLTRSTLTKAKVQPSNTESSKQVRLYLMSGIAVLIIVAAVWGFLHNKAVGGPTEIARVIPTPNLVSTTAPTPTMDVKQQRGERLESNLVDANQSANEAGTNSVPNTNKTIKDDSSTESNNESDVSQAHTSNGQTNKDGLVTQQSSTSPVKKPEYEYATIKDKGEALVTLYYYPREYKGRAVASLQPKFYVSGRYRIIVSSGTGGMCYGCPSVPITVHPSNREFYAPNPIILGTQAPTSISVMVIWTDPEIGNSGKWIVNFGK